MLTTASGESSSVGLVESMVSNHMRSGKRLDLKMDDFSATTDVTKMLALREAEAVQEEKQARVLNQTGMP